MIHEIERKPLRYEDYFVLRGICEKGSTKTVIVEKRFDMSPTEQDIVDFLLKYEKDISFVSLEHNYRLIKENEVPFY